MRKSSMFLNPQKRNRKKKSKKDKTFKKSTKNYSVPSVAETFLLKWLLSKFVSKKTVKIQNNKSIWKERKARGNYSKLRVKVSSKITKIKVIPNLRTSWKIQTLKSQKLLLSTTIMQLWRAVSQTFSWETKLFNQIQM